MTKEEIIELLKNRVRVEAQPDYSECFYSGDIPSVEINLYLDGEFLLSCYTDSYDDMGKWYDKKFKMR